MFANFNNDPAIIRTSATITLKLHKHDPDVNQI